VWARGAVTSAALSPPDMTHQAVTTDMNAHALVALVALVGGACDDRPWTGGSRGMVGLQRPVGRIAAGLGVLWILGTGWGAPLVL
jgi:hypothetical protein